MSTTDRHGLPQRPARHRGPRPDDALVGFAEEHLGQVASWRDASWDHGESEVWMALTASGGDAFLKVHASAGKFDQESRAYLHWAEAAGSTPRLIAQRQERPRALLLTAEPGGVALHVSLGALEGERLYERAGRWLAGLHAVPHQDHDPVGVTRALELRAEAWSRRASGIVSTGDIQRVLDEVKAPWPGDQASASRVPCHRDFTARNWLVDAAGQLTVIDFEHSRPDWSLVDIERVTNSIRHGRAELRQAFERGYGDIPCPESLRRVSLVSALTRIVWAVEHADGAFERAGREELASLLRSSA